MFRSPILTPESFLHYAFETRETTPRAEPIPVYGELGVSTRSYHPAAAAAHGEDIAAGLLSSFTLGTGRRCSKPGFVLVPDTADGHRIVVAVRATLHDISSQTLLNERVSKTYRRDSGTAVAPQRGRCT